MSSKYGEITSSSFCYHKYFEAVREVLIGTLRSNYLDGKEKIDKTIGLISKTTPLYMHHTFLYISFQFLHDYELKMPNFAFYGGRKQETAKFYHCHLKFSVRRVRLHLTK